MSEILYVVVCEWVPYKNVGKVFGVYDCPKKAKDRLIQLSERDRTSNVAIGLEVIQLNEGCEIYI